MFGYGIVEVKWQEKNMMPDDKYKRTHISNINIREMFLNVFSQRRDIKIWSNNFQVIFRTCLFTALLCMWFLYQIYKRTKINIKRTKKEGRGKTLQWIVTCEKDENIHFCFLSKWMLNRKISLFFLKLMRHEARERE